MLRHLLRVLAFYTAVILVLAVAAFADEQPANQAMQEEVWAIPVTLPTIAYVVRPVGDGPFPLVVMNHGVSLAPRERRFFPIVEFRDAAMWFARKGYIVVAPTGSGYGAAALDVPERGLYGPFFSKIGSCDNPNFADAGLAVALLDKWIINYMADQKLIVPDNVVVVGQSAGGWAAIALSSQNLPRSRQSSPLLQGAADASAASQTTIARPTSWLRRQGSSDVPPGSPCSGSTQRTTRFSDQPYQRECMRPVPAQVAVPNITCFRRSEMTGTS